MRSIVAVLLMMTSVQVSAAAGRKLPPPSKLSLVQAQCPGAPPGPCSASFRFASGTAILTSSKQPQPSCHDPDRPKGGQVRLAGVTKDGAPFSGSLHAEVTLKTTFAPDTNNGNCELPSIQIEIPSLFSELACRNGKCKGELAGIACLPGTCADTPFTSEFVSLVVNDDAGQPLAKPGTFVPPLSHDAP